MSRPKYKWWSYVKGVIRDYPELRKKYEDLHTPSLVADYSGMPGGGGGSRALEALAIRELPTNEQREYEAVRRAIRQTERYKNGRERMMVIDLVLWKRSHTIAGAALMVPCHYKTAEIWHREFIWLVGRNYGFLD